MKGTAIAFPLLALGACLPGASDGGGGPDGAIGQQADATPPDAPGLPDASRADAMPMLHGTPPVSPKPVPTFMVLNRDGTPRTQADLIGHPTVIWFYPAATTSG